MRLPSDLISEFVKITNDRTKSKQESTVYGTVVKDNSQTYVRLDGSDILTPVSTTADAQDGERVTVLIKNHSATITGNVSSPAARTGDVQQLGDDVGNLNEENLVISGKLTAAEADISTLKTEKLNADTAEITYAKITDLEATNAELDNLEATHGAFETLTTQNFEAVDAKIDNLEATHGSFETVTTQKFEAVDAKINNLAVGDIEAVYANIDFSNIGKAAMEYLYSESGLIENVIVSDGTITGNLVGVTIKGDLIEGNTVVADKLVIQGQNGLYYKLNTDGVKIEAEQTDYNSLNGSIITAKSIAATKISVDDLVAFDATIGGFSITSDALYSGVKESVDNTTRGTYLDKTGQFAIGDSINFLKYYKDADDNYKLDISLGGSDLQTSIEDSAKTATNFLSYDSADGLQIGDKTGGSWNGFRTQTTSSAFNILDSVGTVLASYGAKLIELGKNAVDAVIKLCGGKGQIEYVTDSGTDDSYLQISSDKLRLKSESLTSLYSTNVNESGQTERSAVNVSPDEVYIYSNSSSLAATNEAISLSTPGDVSITAASVKDSYGQFVSFIEGTSGNWSYKKWSNGDAELWGSQSVSGVACTTAFGDSMYRSNAVASSAFPFTIYSPILTASYESNGYGAFLWATSITTTTSPPTYYLIRATSGTINSGKINFHVTGKWAS